MHDERTSKAIEDGQRRITFHDTMFCGLVKALILLEVCFVIVGHLWLLDFVGKRTIRTSSFRCMGEDTMYPLCIMHNICVTDGKLHAPLPDGLPRSPLWSGEKCQDKVKWRRPWWTVLGLWKPAKGRLVKGVTVLKAEYVRHNFGHVLGDEVWAVYQALELLGIGTSSPFNLLYDGDSERIEMKLFKLLPVSKTFELNNSPPLCFENLVVGFKKLGYALATAKDTCNESNGDDTDGRPAWQGTFQDMVHKFREHSYRHMGIDRSKPRSKTVFVVKRGKFAHNEAIGNVDELVHELELNPVVSKHATVAVDWAGMPLQQQVQTMHDARVFIGLPGSNLMNAIWLHPQTALVVICRHTESWGNEHRIWFSQMPWISKRLLCDDDVDLSVSDPHNNVIIVNALKLTRTVEEELVKLDRAPSLNKFKETLRNHPTGTN